MVELINRFMTDGFNPVNIDVMQEVKSFNDQSMYKLILNVFLSHIILIIHTRTCICYLYVYV